MTLTTATPTPEQVFNDVEKFAATFLWIRDINKKLVRLRYKPVQKQYLANCSRRDLILKARHEGFSTLIQSVFFFLDTTRSVATGTLSHEDETTQKLRRMVDRFYDNLPEGFRPNRKYSNARLATYTDFDSESIIATAGNVNTGRGGTYTHVHGSEVAFWKDAQSIMAGIMQGGNPAIVLESTPNGAQGYFYELCMEALDGNGVWKLHFYPWWLEPSYTIPLLPDEVFRFDDDTSVNSYGFTSEEKLHREQGLTLEQLNWRRVKIHELKHQFIQEYPEDPRSCFLLSGKGYFGDVSHVFTAPMNPEYQDTHIYYAGLDFGQTVDFTVCIVIDATTRQMVDMVRVNQQSWSEMRRLTANVCKKWNAKTLLAESNSMGSTNAEELRKLLVNTTVAEFTTTNLSKAEIMAQLHEALHEGGLALQDYDVLKRELNAFQSSQTPTGLWKLEGAPGTHDDCVIALALALKASLFVPQLYVIE